MRKNLIQVAGLMAVSMLLAACSKGGQLTLEPGARIVKSQGSPYVQIDQGGNALIVEQGKTPTTGVHGYVTIQAISAADLSSSAGHHMVINKPSAMPQ
ncbi:MAG TPA: hypothetical protein PKC28_15470 [Bdellovibrionales bacterium]|nr:hypothetical protein [Bdellovibrionales bacterium]